MPAGKPLATVTLTVHVVATTRLSLVINQRDESRQNSTWRHRQYEA